MTHADRLLEQLQTAICWPDLASIRARVLMLSTHGSLTQAEAQALLPAIHLRGLSLGPPQGAALADLPTVAMTALAQSRRPWRLVIDGHNLLFRLGSVYGPHARDLLIDHACALTHRFPLASVELWFDGDEDETVVDQPRLRVQFAGGKGKDKADKGILQDLWRRRTERDIPTFVVSDDKGVWRRSLGLGGVRVCCAEFRALLGVNGPGAEAEHR
jgi:hypothetical protein